MDIKELIPVVQEYVTKFGFNIVASIAIIILGMWVSKIITNILGKVLTKRNIDLTLTGFLKSALKFILYLFVFVAAVSQLGIETTSFIAVLGAAGLAVGFALQGSLSNVAAGIMLVLFRQVRVGQFIEGGGTSGTIERVGIFNTTLITPDNKVVYVPNSKLINDNIINYSEKETRRVDLVFGISYNDDIDKARKIINTVLENDSRVLKDPKPMVVVSELADNSVNFAVRPWVNSADYWNVYFDTTETIKKKFDEAKISIPFPQRDVHLYQN